MKKVTVNCFAAFISFLMLTSFYPFRPGEYGLNKVVIDAGHGGKDPGAIGVDKIQEKDIVLDIALKVGAAIKKQHPNVTVVYTRDKDIFIGLGERAKIANHMNADLFMSIHADAAASAQAYGTETFALGLHRSKENLETAKRENQAILLEENYEVKYEGFDPSSDESLIALGLMQQNSLAQSLSIASKVQDQFVALGRRNRGVKQAGFMVLYKTTMPSVLIETGFITNTKEGRFLNKAENRNLISNGIVTAFNQYKEEIDILYAPASTKENNQKQLNDKESIDHGVRFKVQITSSPKSMGTDAKRFKGIEGVEEIKINNSYKYAVGNEKSFEDGVSLQGKVREKGYKDAFLISMYKGERIPISQALEIIKNAK